MYDVTTSPSTTDLTTLNAVKEEMGLCLDEGKDDPKIKRLIARASEAIVNRVGRPLARHTITETLPWTQMHRQWLTVTPLVSITSIKLNGQLIPSTEYQVDRRAGSVFREGGWYAGALIGDGITQPPSEEAGKAVYEFIYQGGYYLPTFGAGDGAITAQDFRLPADLEGAAIILTRSLWNASKRDDQVLSESLGDHSKTFVNPVSLTSATTHVRLPDPVEVLLKPYIRVLVR